MRQVTVQVPRSEVARVLDVARRHDASQVTSLEAADQHGAPVQLIMLHIGNRKFGGFVEETAGVPELHLSAHPAGLLSFRPPAKELSDAAADVSPRSPVEIFVSGLQANGSWQANLGFAVAAGIVVWAGLATNSIVLLIGGMLIAPLAGPAINVALSTTSGDRELMKHSLARYTAAIAVMAAVGALLTLVFGPQHATQQMVAVSNISKTAWLLPIVAGFVGGLHLVQSERSSLVSGAASGVIIAAALAPAVVILGMAVVVNEYELLQPSAFLVLLQLFGINLGGAAVLYVAGIRPRGTRLERGTRRAAFVAVALTVIAWAAMLGWQFIPREPPLRHATIAQQARSDALEALATQDDVSVVRITSEFTRLGPSQRNTLLITGQVERRGTQESDEAVRNRITAAIQQLVGARHPTVTPLVDLSVLSAPPPRQPE